MGLILFEGFVMGICFGDLDFVVLVYFFCRVGYLIDDFDVLFNMCSGLVGFVGCSDMCDIFVGMVVGEDDVIFVFDVYVYWFCVYVGVYMVQFGGVDVILFMVGVGENVVVVCVVVFVMFGFVGVVVDFVCNEVRECGICCILVDVLIVMVFVVLMDEELQIVRQIVQLF